MYYISSLTYYVVLIILLSFEISIYISSPEKNTTKETEENAKTIEKLYIKYMLHAKNYNHDVCSLEKSKKVALCSQIFEQIALHTDYNIMLNKVAFFINTAKCEPKPVHFVKNIFFSEEIIMQEMYPCYGRTDPVRTNFIIDDNYDKFYISNGLTDDSIFVYIHEFDIKSDRYLVHSHTNFQLTELTDTFISLQEVADELKMNYNIMLTSPQKEIELIYLREKENPELEDKICELDTEKRVAVCSLIFEESAFNKNYLEIEKYGFFVFQKINIKRKVEMISDQYVKNISILQRMIPCFSKNLREYGNIFESKFFNFTFISEGPRPNSVFVYVQENRYDENYILFELVENIFIDNIIYTDTQPNLQVVGSQRQLINYYQYMQNTSYLLTVRETYKELLLILQEEHLLRILKVRKNLELIKKNSSSGKKIVSKFDHLDSTFSKLQSHILVIANGQVEDRMQKDNNIRKKNIKLDYAKLTKENFIMQQQAHRLIQTSKLKDTIEKIKQVDFLLEEILSQ